MEHTHVLAAATLARAAENNRTSDQIDAFYEVNGCEVWTWFLRLPERLRAKFAKSRKSQEAMPRFANTAATR